MLAESRTCFRVEHALFLETGEGVCIEHLCPFIRIVARRIACGAAKQVAEAPHHRRRRCFQRREVVSENFTIDGVEVFAEKIGEPSVQDEVELGERELAHEGGGAEIVFRGRHFDEKILGNRLAGFEVAGEEIQRFAVPTEILHDLRGQFDKIPRDIGSSERFHFDLTE